MALENTTIEGTYPLTLIGDVLHTLLMRKYSRLYESSGRADLDYWREVSNAISDVYNNDLGISDLPPTTASSTLRVGDIIVLDNKRRYVVTTNGPDIIGDFRTFPTRSEVDQQLILVNSQKVIRPSIASISIEKFKDVLTANVEKARPRLGSIETFRNPVGSLESDGAIQIGDLTFIVDPVQISFTTQNGFTFFPTMRTQGNPQIPTMQQVKNVSITLIFPNENAINYQLLNLYAMYRRTPFVNIRNKDISEFFKDLKINGTDFVPFALESINIQSVDGFPNTLQATLTILPFEPSAVGGGLEAIRSMRGVYDQQNQLNNNYIDQEQLSRAANNLKNETINPSLQSSFVTPFVDRTANFKGSLPFRSFYQAIIKDHEVVRDEWGDKVSIVNEGDTPTNKFASLGNFAPSNSVNYLRHYHSDENLTKIKLSYSYISTSFRDFAKSLSKERFNIQNTQYSQLNELYKNFNTSTDLVNMTIQGFLSTQDLWRTYDYQMNEVNNVISRFLALHGIDQEFTNSGVKVEGLFSYIFKSFLQKTNIEQIIATYSQLQRTAKGEASIITDDILGLLQGVVVDDINTGKTSTNGVHTLMGYFDELVKWAESAPDDATIKVRKAKLIAAFNGIASSLRKEMSSDVLIVDANEDPSEPFRVVRLPIARKEIELNTNLDIIVGWNLTFANKFVPMTLAGYKYPYYQHLGFEDASLSLNVTSLKTSKFKEELSELSERLYESVKVITLNAPNLLTWLDPRIEIEADDHSIFGAFGIKYVVLNTTNTTNIPENPDSWRTILNLTQANFTVAQYHTVEEIENISSIKDALATLIPRLVVEGNSLAVKTYYKVENGSKTQITDLDDIIRLSLWNSPIGLELEQTIYESLGQTNSSKETRYGFDLFRSLNAIRSESDVKDNVSIEVTITSLPENVTRISGMVLTLSNLHSRYQELQRRQVESIKSFFSKKDTLIVEIFKTIVKSQAIGVAAAVSALFLPLWIVTPVAIVIFGGVVAYDAISGAFNRLKDEFSPVIISLLAAYKKSLLLELSNLMLKDPTVQETLLGADLLGKNYKEELDRISNQSQIKCHKDFDFKNFDYVLPDGKRVLLSPDFYFYNQLQSNFEIYEYVGESFNRIIDATKLSSMGVFAEYKQILERFDELKQTIDFQADRKIIEDFGLEIGYKENLEQSLDQLMANYRSFVFPDKFNMTEEQKQSYLQEWETANAKLLKTHPEQYSADKRAYESALAIGVLKVDMDEKKLSIVHAARLKTLLEIIELYSAIIEYFKTRTELQNPETKATLDVLRASKLKESKVSSFFDFLRNKYSTETLTDISIKQIELLKDDIKYILDNAKNITTETVPDKISNKYIQTLSNAEANKKEFVSPPDLRILQATIYNKIGNFIRLNSAIQEYRSGGDPRGLLADLPELKYAEVWNNRELESQPRQTDLIRQLLRTGINTSRRTTKMFPAFKIYFVEEDKGIYDELDEFYAYEAIQSIEIIKNKHMASSTAVIRLSNATGTITDRYSFMTEKSDMPALASRGDPDNVFFGTLDVKPGTMIVIKMGFSGSDKALDTVFVGRVIEMNPGSQVEMVCQSFGAQLNNEIMSEKFGFLSSEREHGDVASAILDLIPGLEKLGKENTNGFSLSPTVNFTGSNYKKMRTKFLDNLMLSNILGRTTADMFVQNNPRDENIYLPFYIGDNRLYRPTFDWVVFEQTVWEALQELTLYHRNVVPIIKPYNDDPYSRLGDLRETVVIGDKSGYYKYTDSYGISSINVDSIEKIVNDWAEIRDNLYQLAGQLISIDASEGRLRAGYLVPLDLTSYLKKRLFHNIWSYTIATGPVRIELSQPTLGELPEGVPGTFESLAGEPVSIKLFPDWTAQLWLFLEDRQSASTLMYKLTKSIDTSIRNFSEATSWLIKSTGVNKSNVEELINLIAEFISYPAIGSSINGLSSIELVTGDNRQKWEVFVKILGYIVYILNNESDAGLKLELVKEEVSHITSVVSNTDTKLSTDLRYKKIQGNYLVTDVADIISNNISLNSNFNNAVNLYYFTDPKFISLNSMQKGDIEKLNVWPIKSFGDLKDEHIRTLNSFQKNIDTNWWEIRKLVKDFEMIRLKTTEKFKLAEAIFKENPHMGTPDLITPDWRYYPAFIVVANSLLRREVQKMYGGTLELVGNPNLQPMDILHIEDYVNDMHGAVEIEEVIHRFTPETGFITIVTPNMITYDRDPIQLDDVGIMNRVYKLANFSKNRDRIVSGIGGGVLTSLGAAAMLATPINWGVGIGGLSIGLPLLWNGIVGAENTYTKFMYEQLGNFLGRDCINFTTLTYHGFPYMTGFGGVDYTSLKTVINHKVLDVQGLMSRISAFSDPFAAAVLTDYDPQQFTMTQSIINKYGWLRNIAQGTPDHNKLNTHPLRIIQ